MSNIISVPSIDGTSKLFINADQIRAIIPFPDDSGKCGVSFAQDHMLPIGCGAAVLASAIRSGGTSV